MFVARIPFYKFATKSTIKMKKIIFFMQILVFGDLTLKITNNELFLKKTKCIKEFHPIELFL